MQHFDIDGLEPQEQRAVDWAIRRLNATRDANLRRMLYADSKMTIKALGLQDQALYRRVETVIGWPAKAVRSLSSLCRNQGVFNPNGDDLGLQEWWDDNNLDVESSQAQDLSLIYGPAFLVTTKGDTAAGEPEVLTTIKPPLSGTGDWNARTRRLDFFVSVHEVENRAGEDSRPTNMTLYIPGKNLSIWNDEDGWHIRATPSGLPYVAVDPLVFQARHDRPLGTARISRPVMSITDNAIRTIVRAELGAEAYANPQRYLLGADMSQFTDETGLVDMSNVWAATLGRVAAIGLNEDTVDEKSVMPQFGQLQQLSMTPHMDQLESYAAQFASETDLPVSSLGITKSQNPASAEAIVAAKDDLINVADKAMLEWSGAWERAAMSAHMLREGVTEKPSGTRIKVKWRDPRTLNLAASADAVIKLTQGSNPIIPPESDVPLEMLGLSDAMIERIQSDRRRIAGRNTLAGLADQVRAQAVSQDRQPVVNVESTANPDDIAAAVQAQTDGGPAGVA